MELYMFIMLGSLFFVVICWLICSCDEQSEHMTESFKNDAYLSINLPSYRPYYYNTCNSPFCRRRWWYNNYTPFIWNNPTKYPTWTSYPPYARMSDYLNYYPYY